MLASDYFHHGGHYYAVIVDRYSHWPVVFRAEHDHTGAKGLIAHLRLLFSTYGVPEEISSDGAKEYTAQETQDFLKKWQVHHRLSSVAFAHSNCRAELGVKQIKRIITDNCSPSGSLNIDSFHRAILSYRNTVDPVTKFSPALAVFGRQMRDGLPVLPGHYNPHNTWKEILDHRERAMAQRHVAHHEAWSEHTAKLGPLEEGMKVFIQNQVGNSPRRWDKTGTIMECKDFDQYLVKVDGTGRLTLRNRKFLRRLTPIKKHTTPASSLKTPLPSMFPNTPHIDLRTPEQRNSTNPAFTRSQDATLNPNHSQDHLHQSPPNNTEYQPNDLTMTTETPSCDPEKRNLTAPQTPPTSRSPPTPTYPRTPPPTTPTHRSTPQDTTQSQRPHRTRRPNVKYSGNEWALDTLLRDPSNPVMLHIRAQRKRRIKNLSLKSGCLKASMGGGR